MNSRRFCSLVLLLLSSACGEGNTSDVSADYDSIRVRQVSLSDKDGQTLVTLSADRSSSGAPRIVLRDPRGAVLQTIDLEARR